jgi:hypothetical protein
MMMGYSNSCRKLNFLFYILPLCAAVENLAVFKQNQWQLSNFLIQRPLLQDPTPDLSFSLYRTLAGECNPDCSWQISPTPVGCQYGMVSPSSQFRIPSGEWKECQTYPLNPTGEERIPQELKQWIRWRVTSLNERPRVDNSSFLDLVGLKLQVVQGVPINRYFVVEYPTVSEED